MSAVLTKPYDFAVLGVFTNIGWEREINIFLSKNPNKLYWLPWGNRIKGWYIAGKYLAKHKIWEEEERQTSIGKLPIDYLLL